MSYLSVRDSFCTAMAGVLALENPVIPFHWCMFDGDDPTQERLLLNAVNVAFLTDDSDGTLDVSLVSVDVISTKERTALAWQDLLTKKILRQSGMIKNKDFSVDPDNPTDNYGNVYWNIREIKWVNVDNPNYCHLNATFELYHFIATSVL